MRKNTVLFLLCLTLLFPASAQAGYWKNLGNDWTRGLKNIVSSPLEIPLTIQEHRKRSSYPVVKCLTGTFDGIFQTVARFGSGAWDLIPAGVIPGIQEGLPVDPETLF